MHRHLEIASCKTLGLVLGVEFKFFSGNVIYMILISVATIQLRNISLTLNRNRSISLRRVSGDDY